MVAARGIATRGTTNKRVRTQRAAAQRESEGRPPAKGLAAGDRREALKHGRPQGAEPHTTRSSLRASS
eukprot:6827980-Prymnesium_polylepis.1